MKEPKRFTLAQIDCTVGGWAPDRPPTDHQIDTAQNRWSRRSFRDDVKDADGWIEHQCGGCHFFAATGADFGICWNVDSPLDGCVTFEHGGCSVHSARKKTAT